MKLSSDELNLFLGILRTRKLLMLQIYIAFTIFMLISLKLAENLVLFALQEKVFEIIQGLLLFEKFNFPRNFYFFDQK